MPLQPESLTSVARERLRATLSAEQTMGMATVHRRWTTADVRALMDEARPWPRYELIDGELFVTPAPGNRHQLWVTEVLRFVADYVETQGVGVACVSPADLELRDGSITQPDVFVLPVGAATPSDGWETVKELLLAVEVLSPSSLRTDRVIKRDYYLDAGVPEYWIVDADARAIERWTPIQETPNIARDRLVWQPTGAMEPLILDVSRFFDRVNRLIAATGLR